MRIVITVLFIVLLVLPAPAKAAELQAASSVKSVIVDGEKLRYTARWTPLYLRDENGVADAMISATSYVLDTSGKTRRPLVFLFNGGPGASSSPLHFTLGPRHWARDDDGNRVIVANEHTLLAHADLVFIDPVGTGFSRNLGDDTPYWNRDGDVGSVMRFVEFWLQRHGQGYETLYVAGESYGAFRLASMLPMLMEHEISGAILVSPALDFSGESQSPGNDLPYLGLLPSMAVAAWHHGLAHGDLDSAEAVWRKARAFSASTYLHALHQGLRLDATERARVADEMAKLIGIDAELILDHHLRLPTQVFLENLLDDYITGRLDVRVTAPKADRPGQPDRPAGANDPALGMGPSNKIISAPIRDYLVGEIGVDTDLEYYSLNLDLNFAWDWRPPEPGPSFYVNPAFRFGEAMEVNPDFRLFVVGGYYDLATPVHSVERILTRPVLDRERVEMHFLPTSHSPFSSLEHRPGLIEELHRFMSQ